MTAAPTKTSARPFVFAMENDQCVWSRAGIVKTMKCLNAFDCLGCAFDRKVQADFAEKEKLAGHAGGSQRPVRLNMLINQLKCRHMLSGRVSYKLCAHGYNCAKCPYDQMVDDTGLLPQPNAPVCDNAAGFDVARDHYYHHGHGWARVEYGGRVRVGLDDFALRLMGPPDEIQLPKLGASLDQNRPNAVVRRGANDAETLSPVEGKVVAVNSRITARAATANEAPYADGWLMVIQPNRLQKNLKNLFFGTESLAWIDDEAARLNELVSTQTGHRLAATGGEVVRDIFGTVPAIGWKRLVTEFLR